MLILYCQIMNAYPTYGVSRDWYHWMLYASDRWDAERMCFYHACYGNVAGFTAGTLAWWLTGRRK